MAVINEGKKIILADNVEHVGRSTAHSSLTSHFGEARPKHLKSDYRLNFTLNRERIYCKFRRVSGLNKLNNKLI